MFDQTSFSKYLLTGSGRRAGTAVVVHRGCGCPGGQVGLHRHAQRARHLRVRRHRHPDRGAGVPDRQQRGDHRTGQGPHPQEPAGRGAGRTGRRHVVDGGVRGDGPEVTRSAGEPDRRRPVRRGVPVRHQPADRAGVCHRAGHPDHLCRRTGLGALRSRGVRGRGLRGPAGGRRAVRHRPRRLLRDRVDAAGEGLPGLRPRIDAQREPRRSRAAVRLQAQDRHRLPRPRGGGEGQGRRPAQAAGRAFASRAPSRCCGVAS